MDFIFFTPLEGDEEEEEEDTAETWGTKTSWGMVGSLEEYWLRSLLFGLVAADDTSADDTSTDDTSADDDDDNDDDGGLLSLILIVKESKL